MPAQEADHRLDRELLPAEERLVVTAGQALDVAAGVSPGLVQHHFGTKAGLREAVDEYLIAVAAETFQDVVQDGAPTEAWAAMGRTTTDWVRDNAVALRYLARGLAEGDPGATEIFRALVAIARDRWLGPLAESGLLSAR